MVKPQFKGKYRVESIRLPNRDYVANGWYFVTICTQNRTHFFGDIITTQPPHDVETRNFASLLHQNFASLSPIGKIAQQFWAEIPNHFAHVYLDAYVIMPNHVHGIIVIDRPPILSSIASTPVETRNFASLQPSNGASVPSVVCASVPPDTQTTDQSNKFGPLKPGSLQAIVHAYKSSVTRWCRKNGFDDFGWQPRFYEHIIRADGSLDRIRQYIINNPAKWADDQKKPANLWM